MPVRLLQRLPCSTDRLIAVLLVGLLTPPAAGAGATLQPESLAAWKRYVEISEARWRREISDGQRFLGQDFESDAARRRRDLLAGAVLVDHLESLDRGGNPIDVPSATIHHWRGAVFIPGADLGDLVRALEGGEPAAQDDVLAFRVLEAMPDDAIRVFLRLQRKKFVLAVYDTEHLVRFTRHGPSRASSTSTATRITEVANPGTPAEHELPEGQDRGFLWRWNAYWRYEAVAGGVIVECESVSLSRHAPELLWSVIRPMVNSTARESMERTLLTMRGRFSRAGESGHVG
jgi:hypothetical protein